MSSAKRQAGAGRAGKAAGVKKAAAKPTKPQERTPAESEAATGPYYSGPTEVRDGQVVVRPGMRVIGCIHGNGSPGRVVYVSPDGVLIHPDDPEDAFDEFDEPAHYFTSWDGVTVEAAPLEAPAADLGGRVATAEAEPGKKGLSSAEVRPGMRVEGCLAGEYHEGVVVDVCATGCFIRISDEDDEPDLRGEVFGSIWEKVTLQGAPPAELVAPSYGMGRGKA